MKMLRILLIAILISLVGYPAYSEEPLVLYDNFRGKSIDPNKWEPKEVSDGILDVKRFIKWNRLHLMGRAVEGTGGGVVRLALQNSEDVTAIQAKLKVKNIEVVGCGSSVRAGRLSGYFFNTVGDGNGVPGDHTNDVLAGIEIRRDSDSLDPDGMLSIRGFAFHCANNDCGSGDFLFWPRVDLGTIMVGEWTKLLIQWDRILNQFIFQRDNGPEEIRIYDTSDYPDDFLPNFPDKRIGISVFASACPMGEQRPVGYADVVIKNVFVNESALDEE